MEFCLHRGLFIDFYDTIGSYVIFLRLVWLASLCVNKAWVA